MPGWKFVTNYSLVLCQIAQQPRITIRELSLTIGITEKAIHRIITDLETDGYITKIREGRRLRYRINPDLCLRDEMLQDKAVGDLLEVLGWRRQHKPTQRRELVAVGGKAEL
jgi:DNA-binding transcriptional ArsR family regulator